MDHLSHNRRSWNAQSAAGGPWSVPVDVETIAQARAGAWQVILTPRVPVPRDWLGELRGVELLGLASGGGQQMPVLAAAGAAVVSFDLSDEQLDKDRMVAERDGLAVRCVRGDMADLSVFPDASFDLVFHPVSNCFVPDVEPVWRECGRVLRPGGRLLSGFMNPAVFLFDNEEADRTGTLLAKYPLPYSDTGSLPPEALARKVAANEPMEHSHSLDAQIGGQLRAGFSITGFYEDHWLDATWTFSKFAPLCFATRAIRV